MKMSLNVQFLKNLQRFRLVTFDVTDTLLRLKDPSIQYAATAAEYGVHSLDKELIRNCFRREYKKMDKIHPNFGLNTPNMSWQQWWMYLVNNVLLCVNGNITQQQLDQIGKKLIHIYRTSECWSHIDSGLEFIQNVRKAGKSVGVISNFDPSLTTVLHEMDLIDKFDFILTSYSAGIGKPNEKIFRMPLEQLKIDASQALHIGNNYNMDYLGARNSGWSSLLIKQSGKEEAMPQSDSESKYVYASLADMLSALQTKAIEW